MFEVISNILLLAVTAALLVHFVLIVRYASYIAQEPNPVILFAEVVMLLAILCYSVVRVIVGIRR